MGLRDKYAYAISQAKGRFDGSALNDIRIIHRAFERLEVGALIVNDVNTFRVDQMPYGGVKQSGFGVEFAEEGLKEFTTIQTVFC